MSPTTTHTSPDQARAADVARQLVVAGSAVVALLGLAVGLGAFDAPETADAAGGALSSTATVIAPAGPAFAIWTPIYAGLMVLAVWQLTPRRRTDPRQRRAGWGIAVTMFANAAWLLVVASGGIWASVAVIGILLVALAFVSARLTEQPPSSGVEALIVDTTMGAYPGWVCVAAIANVAAALVTAGTSATGTGPVIATVVMLGVAAGVGWFVAGVSERPWAFSFAVAWGLAWVAIGRYQGPTQSIPVAVAAAAAAVAVLAASVLARTRRRP